MIFKPPSCVVINFTIVEFAVQPGPSAKVDDAVSVRTIDANTKTLRINLISDMGNPPKFKKLMIGTRQQISQSGILKTLARHVLVHRCLKWPGQPPEDTTFHRFPSLGQRGL
jgi:hypothetical protein